MFSKKFLVRVAEEAVAAGVAGFSGALIASGRFSAAGVTGALSAAGMAVLGVLRRNVGEPDRPTVK